MAGTPRQKFLILGGSGYLGRRLYRLLGPKRAVATFHTTPFEGGVHFDATRMRLADTLLRGPQEFAAAFVLYGATRIDDCAHAPESTTRLNVETVIRTIDELLSAGIKPIYASTDAVFDGTKGNWTEGDPPNPILTYGRQKAAVEEHLVDKAGPWIIARLSKLVGTDDDSQNLLAEWMRQIENEEIIHCATDLIFTPVDAMDAASALVRLASPSLSGIYNVCGPRSMSRMELLRILLRAIQRYRRVSSKVIECSIRDIPFVEPRPVNNSMSSAKLAALGRIRLRNMESVCADLARKRHNISARSA